MLPLATVSLMWKDFVCIVSIRNAHGGGLMILIRNDICFHVVTRFNIDMSSFRTESMLLKVQIKKSLFAIVGIYRSPNIPKSQWKIELSAIFGAATTSSNDSISTVI